MKLTVKELRFWIKTEGKNVTLKNIRDGRVIAGYDPVTGK